MSIPNSRVAVFTIAVVLAAAMMTLLVIWKGETLFAASGLWALALVLLPPALKKNYDLFSIWSFAALTIVIGVTLRGLAISFGYPNHETLDRLYFLGRDLFFFSGPAFLLILGILMLALGYMAVPFRKRTSPFSRRNWSRSRLYILSLGILAVSTIATFLYIRATGGFESGLLSAKRTVIPDLELAGSGYHSHGGLRFLASLAIFGHLLVLADALSTRRTWKFGLAAVLLLVACLVPFYASLRTSVAMNLCFSAALFHYAGLRIRGPIIAAVLMGAALIIYAMTVMRPSSPKHEQELAAPNPARVFDAAVINRNQIDLPKTAHIIHALPHELDFQYGRTIARWTVAPVPRRFWANKPVIPPGPEIGREVYGQRVAGVPPGLVAELFWNFHLPGLIVGAFGFGMLLRFLNARFQPERRGNLMAATLYVAGPMTLGFEAIGSSIGSGLFRATLQGVLMFMLLFFVQRSDS